MKRLITLTAALLVAASCGGEGTADTVTGPSVPNTAMPTRPRSGAVRPRAVPSAAACSGVAPGRRRPMPANMDSERLLGFSLSTGRIANGSHARVSRSGNAKSRGMTATTSCGVPSS